MAAMIGMLIPEGISVVSKYNTMTLGSDVTVMGSGTWKSHVSAPDTVQATGVDVTIVAVTYTATTKVSLSKWTVGGLKVSPVAWGTKFTLVRGAVLISITNRVGIPTVRMGSDGILKAPASTATLTMSVEVYQALSGPETVKVTV